MFTLIAMLIGGFGIVAYLKTVPKQKQKRGLDRLIDDITKE